LEKTGYLLGAKIGYLDAGHKTRGQFFIYYNFDKSLFGQKPKFFEAKDWYGGLGNGNGAPEGRLKEGWYLTQAGGSPG
jgi:hypothetical protein